MITGLFARRELIFASAYHRCSTIAATRHCVVATSMLYGLMMGRFINGIDSRVTIYLNYAGVAIIEQGT